LPTVRGAGPQAPRVSESPAPQCYAMTKPAYAKWYSLAAWRRRRTAQLATEPLCRYCQAIGHTRAATVVDHIIPHRGDWSLFIEGELQSLCKSCHDSVAQAKDTHGHHGMIGADGFPVDQAHPFNR
jgi:5-methylcytosine-specific restriction enzyme A